MLTTKNITRNFPKSDAAEGIRLPSGFKYISDRSAMTIVEILVCVAKEDNEIIAETISGDLSLIRAPRFKFIFLVESLCLCRRVVMEDIVNCILLARYSARPSLYIISLSFSLIVFHENSS